MTTTLDAPAAPVAADAVARPPEPALRPADPPPIHFTPRPEQPRTTFITWVEAGPAEDHVLRLVESLRRWGGRYSQSPILIVAPRPGPPPAASTLKQLASLGAAFAPCPQQHRYTWFDRLNKPLAVIEAERLAATATITYLDPRLIVLGEPDELPLGGGEDFAAVPGDPAFATFTPGDPHEAYWWQACAQTGVVFHDLPRIDMLDGAQARLTFDGLVFSCRRLAGLGRHYYLALRRLMEGRLASSTRGYVINDEASMTLAVHRMRLRWRRLSAAYPTCYETAAPPSLGPASPPRLLLAPDCASAQWTPFLRRVEAIQPQASAWLSARAPRSGLTPWRSVLAAMGRFSRARRAAAFQRSCAIA